MGNRQFLIAQFSEVAALALGSNPKTRLYSEALAKSLSRQKPEVVADIMETLAKSFPDPFADVVARRLRSLPRGRVKHKKAPEP